MLGRNQRSLYNREFAELFDHLHSWGDRYTIEQPFFKSLIKKNNIRTVLDCGSGNGFHLSLFGNLVGLSNVFGLERSMSMRLKSRQNLKAIGLSGITIFKGDLNDVTRILKEKDKFDLITCIYTLSVATNGDTEILKVLKSLKGHLTKDGTLFIDDLNIHRIINNQGMPDILPFESESYNLLRFGPVKIKVYKSRKSLMTDSKHSRNEVVIRLENGILYKWLRAKHRIVLVYNVIKTHLIVDYIFIMPGLFRWLDVRVYREKLTLLKKETLNKLLTTAGFKNIRFYGGYKFKSFKGTEFNMLVTAQR